MSSAGITRFSLSFSESLGYAYWMAGFPAWIKEGTSTKKMILGSNASAIHIQIVLVSPVVSADSETRKVDHDQWDHRLFRDFVPEAEGVPRRRKSSIAFVSLISSTVSSSSGEPCFWL